MFTKVKSVPGKKYSGYCRQATQGLPKISELYVTVYSMSEYQEVINSSVVVR